VQPFERPIAYFLQYNAALRTYGSWIVDCQYTRLVEFMSGVERLAREMHGEEVQFQPGFSKQDLRRVLKENKKTFDKVLPLVIAPLSVVDSVCVLMWSRRYSHATRRLSLLSGTGVDAEADAKTLV
jgi:hypothetical protein